jgi:hypothetical protein
MKCNPGYQCDNDICSGNSKYSSCYILPSTFYQFNYRNRINMIVVSFGEFQSEMLLFFSTSHQPTQHGRRWGWKSNWSFVFVFKYGIKFPKFYFCSNIKINTGSSAFLHFELSFCWDAHFTQLWVQHFLYHSLHLAHCTLPWFSLSYGAVLK